MYPYCTVLSPLSVECLRSRYSFYSQLAQNINDFTWISNPCQSNKEYICNPKIHSVLSVKWFVSYDESLKLAKNCKTAIFNENILKFRWFSFQKTYSACVEQIHIHVCFLSYNDTQLYIIFILLDKCAHLFLSNNLYHIWLFLDSIWQKAGKCLIRDVIMLSD